MTVRRNARPAGAFFFLTLVLAAGLVIVGGLCRARAEGIDIGAAVAGRSSPADWVDSTVAANREAWRVPGETPDELFGAFDKAPFSDALNIDHARTTKAYGNALRAGCGADCLNAALDTMYNAVNRYETVGGGAIGGSVQFVKRWYNRASAVAGIATAEGTLTKRLVDFGIEAAKDQAKDVGTEAAKDTVNKGDPAIQQKIEDKAKAAYNAVMDYFKKGPIVFTSEEKINGCDVSMLWLWDGKTLDLYVYGRCGCAPVKNSRGVSVTLDGFAAHLRATTKIDVSSDPKKPIISIDSAQLVELTADCLCGKERPATVAPPPLPVVVKKVVPPYTALPKDRKVCKDCTAELDAVRKAEEAVDAAQSEIRDAAGDVHAATSAIQLAKDLGKVPDPADVQRLKDAEGKNTELTNKLADAITAWRAAVDKLEACEKICKEHGSVVRPKGVNQGEYASAPPSGRRGDPADGLVAEINAARADPPAYAKTFGNLAATPGAAEAVAFLDQQPPAPPLTAEPLLASAAARHVADQGPGGLLGHIGTDGSTARDRIQAAGIFASIIAEDISLGQTTPEAVVHQWIIDRGVAGSPHRADLFNHRFQFAGVACGPHRAFHEMCVLDLAGAILRRTPPVAQAVSSGGTMLGGVSQ